MRRVLLNDRRLVIRPEVVEIAADGIGIHGTAVRGRLVVKHRRVDRGRQIHIAIRSAVFVGRPDKEPPLVADGHRGAEGIVLPRVGRLDPRHDGPCSIEVAVHAHAT